MQEAKYCIRVITLEGDGSQFFLNSYPLFFENIIVAQAAMKTAAASVAKGKVVIKVTAPVVMLHTTIEEKACFCLDSETKQTKISIFKKTYLWE